MTNVFEVVDPRGYKIVCTEDSFNNHILIQHPQMKGREAEIQETIGHPTLGCIYQDANRPSRNIYYRLSKNRESYIKVVVEINQDQTGRVITAFPTSAPKSGEKLIWPD